MIHSIQFTGNEDGYLMEKQYEEVFRNGMTQEKYIKLSVHERRANYNKYKKQVYRGYANELAKSCLINKKFEFSPNKINILFGPNGCGKSTIIKTIASHSLCGKAPNHDGWTNIMHFDPIDIDSMIFFLEPTERMDIKKSIIGKHGNEAIVEWDGVPVFFNDIENMHQTGSIGDLIGGTFQDIKEEFIFRLESNSNSKGQVSTHIIGQLIRRMQNLLTIDKLIEDRNKTISKMPLNNAWKTCFDLQLEYYQNILNDSSKPEHEINTFMFDEIDKSLDIANVVLLYTEVLPALQKQYGVQIITVSHSPIILSSAVYDNPAYNVISLDKKYTEETRNLLSGIHF